MKQPKQGQIMPHRGRYLLVMAVLSIFVTSDAEIPTVQTTASMILALTDFFKIDCFDLVSTDLRNQVTATRLARIITQKNIATAMLDSTTLIDADNKTRYCLRPLHLLLYDTKDVSRQLTQLAQRIRLAGPIWLLFLERSLLSVDEALFKVNIPFDCEFLIAQSSGEEVLLFEVYRVQEALSLRKEKFGSWSEEKGLTANPGGLYTRRDSLHGITLRATNVHDPPLSIVTVINGTMHLSGFCGSIWKLLESRMNFTTIHGIPKVGGNRWEEMMFQLIRGEADVTATYIAHTMERDIVIDFTIPLARIPLRIFISELTGKEVEWSDILSPFSWTLWMAFLGSTLTAALMLALMYQVIQLVAHTDEKEYSIKDAVFLVFGNIFCQQGHAQTPKTSPLRIVHIVTLLVGIIAFNAYAGVLISYLTVVIPTLPFRTMEEIYADKDYSFGMKNKSLTHIQLTNATDGILKQLFERHIKNQPINAPADYLPGFERVCATKFAFVALSESLTLLRDQLNCTIIYIPEYFSTFSASLGFPKESPYRGLFNHNLLRLLTGGVLRQLHRVALNERPSISSDDIAPINLEAVTPIFSIVATGIVVAFLMMVGEKLMSTRIKSATTKTRFMQLMRWPRRSTPAGADPGPLQGKGD